MKIRQDVMIPLMSADYDKDVSLLRWHVADGSYVVIGQDLFDIEIEKVVYSIGSMDTGFVKIDAYSGEGKRAGDLIGIVLCDVPENGAEMIGIELMYEQLAKLDSVRGPVSRRDYLAELIGNYL